MDWMIYIGVGLGVIIGILGACTGVLGALVSQYSEEYRDKPRWFLRADLVVASLITVLGVSLILGFFMGYIDVQAEPIFFLGMMLLGMFGYYYSRLEGKPHVAKMWLHGLLVAGLIGIALNLYARWAGLPDRQTSAFILPLIILLQYVTMLFTPKSEN